MLLTKDNPPLTTTVDGHPAPVEAPAATGSDYRRILVEGRKKQLAATAENLRRLERTFDSAARSIISKIETIPEERRGTPYYNAQLQLLRDIDTTLKVLKREFGDLMQVGMTDVAQTAADRQAATERLINRPVNPSLVAKYSRTLALSDGAEVSVQFGRLALGAVERMVQRYYSDGLTLSDRLYKLDVGMRKVIEDTLVQGLTEQASGAAIAKRLEGLLIAGGADNPRYQAMRLARTEISNAHREATILGTLNDDGSMKPYISGVRWNLSASHPRIDICDAFASYNDGIYDAGDVPSDHPHGLCYLTPVLKDYADVGGPGKQAKPDQIPESQLRYYASQGDPAAAALLV